MLQKENRSQVILLETIAQRTYNQNPDKVFKTLLNILNENYDITRVEESIRTIEVSSGMSWLSFGETFEIIVVSHDGGSIVRIKAKSRLRWNITSDVEEKTNRIFQLLDEQFL